MKKYLAIKPTAKLESHPTNTRSNLSSSASTLRLTTGTQPTFKPGRSTLHIRSVSSSAISNLGAPRAQNRKETIPSLQTVAVVFLRHDRLSPRLKMPRRLKAARDRHRQSPHFYQAVVQVDLHPLVLLLHRSIVQMVMFLINLQG